MTSFRRYFDHLLLAAIVGATGLTVSTIREMSTNIQTLTTYVQILTEKVTRSDKGFDDHETRIRTLEMICKRN